MLTLYPDRLKRDLAAAVFSAASGGKRNAGYGVISAAFPPGSPIVLQRAGVTVFATTLSSFSVADGLLKMPRSYGAVVTHSVADIDTGTWSLKITNGNNSLTGAVTKSGGAGPFFLTGDIAADEGLAFGVMSFSLPATLDQDAFPSSPPPSPAPVPGPAPAPAPVGSMSLDAMLANMSGDSVQLAFGNHNNSSAHIYIPINHEAAVAASTFNGTAWTTMTEYYDAMSTWLWFYYAQGNTATGKRLQMRGLTAAILRRSTNVWVNLPQGGRQNYGQMWYGTRATSDIDGSSHTENIRNETEGASVIFTRADMGAEMWDQNFYTLRDRSLLLDARCFAAFCQVRVINDARDSAGNAVPYTGTDARYGVMLGCDYQSTNKNVVGSAGGGWGHHATDGPGYKAGAPRFVWDAGNGRWQGVDGSMGWTNVGVICYDKAHDTVNGAGAPAPWGNWAYPPWPYNKAPYCLTEAQIRANPPPWLV